MVPTPQTEPAGAHPQVIEPDAPSASAGNVLPPPRCGHSRLLFEGDPSLRPPARPDWWLCPPSRSILLGRTPHTNNVARRRHVGDTP
jgi:hypothetical protein